MFLLYLDDSGSTRNADEKYLVLAGVSIFERQVHWVGSQLDRLAQDLWPESPDSLEFHATEIFSGKKHWRGIPKEKRILFYKMALSALANNKKVALFAAAINKAAISPKDPMEYAFEQIASRFDQSLMRKFRKQDPQRGVIVLDKSSYETSLQTLAREFKTTGHSWGKLRNMAEVPLFVDSRATRMIQYADLVAAAVRKKYESNESDYFDIIAKRFDEEGGIIHGLVHHTFPQSGCNCPACLQKKGY